MKQIQAPEFLSNLYRDMRDRRLLLPAAALLVCLIAIPQLLSSSSTTTPPAPTVPITNAGKQTAAEPAVVTEQLGVTNYRKRLEQFKSKNPFRQQFTTPKVTPAASLPGSSTVSTGTTSATTLSTPTTSTSSTSFTSTVPTSSTTESSSTSPTQSTSSTSDAGGTSSQSAGHEHHHNAPKPVTKLIQRRIDVKVGRASNMREKSDVEQLTFLPYAAKPLVAYLGTSENGKKAFFLVSTDVTSAAGDGHCLNTTSTCQYLTLKEGQVESFSYGPDPAATYRLKLLDIRDVVIEKTQG